MRLDRHTFLNALLWAFALLLVLAVAHRAQMVSDMSAARHGHHAVAHAPRRSPG